MKQPAWEDTTSGKIRMYLLQEDVASARFAEIRCSNLFPFLSALYHLPFHGNIELAVSEGNHQLALLWLKAY
jgi:hypothetical protein